MRLILLIVIAYFPVLLTPTYSNNFEDYFNDISLRVDYYHTGNALEEFITLDKIYAYGIWPGSTQNLIDNFNNGRYYIKAYDKKSGKLIFSRGFDSYFGEYQTTDAAINGVRKTYHESLIMPYPRQETILKFYARDESNALKEIHSFEINPDAIDIIRMNYHEKNIEIINAHISGDPHTKLDIAVLGEGYTQKESAKFQKDIERFKNTLLNFEPYALLKDKINIYGVVEYSAESGVDEPGRGKFRNSSLDATFNSLGSERYLLTENNKALRDVAGNVPYDAIFIMVNSDRYGGGGIYNFYCTFTSDNQWYEYLILHEMGHSFAGLADEYYTSATAYNEFYKAGVEPVEANITALQDSKLKWAEYVAPGTPIPTPWDKALFDSLDIIWQKKRASLNSAISELSKANAPEDEINDLKTQYDKLDRERAEEVERFLKKMKYYGKAGAFEGAGYTSEGLYRPEVDCIMFSKGRKPFCSVCEGYIKKVIKYYSE